MTVLWPQTAFSCLVICCIMFVEVVYMHMPVDTEVISFMLGDEHFLAQPLATGLFILSGDGLCLKSIAANYPQCPEGSGCLCYCFVSRVWAVW